jgi:hypothetical protein
MNLFKDNLLNTLLDRKKRYIPVRETVKRWRKNRHRKYSVLDFNDIQTSVKSSDTIFILGTGSSINQITDKQWRVISSHDSFGLNWWALHQFVPTYYYSEYPHGKVFFSKYLSLLGPKFSNDYTETLFFLSFNRAVRRGIHPKATNELFPENSKVCFFNYEKPLRFESENSITPDDFRRTLFHRGTLTAVLELVRRIGYKRIVLLGVDLVNHSYFYDNYPEMQWSDDLAYLSPASERAEKPYFAVESFSRKKFGLHDYLFKAYDLYYKPEGIEFFTGSKESLLAEEIPVFDFNEA